MKQLRDHLISQPSQINLSKQIEFLFQQQIQTWPLLKNNVEALQNIERRKIAFKDFSFEIQHNPARIHSTIADTRKTVIEKRPCFLCVENLPSEQKGILLLKRYLLLANPYPIFQRHLTISDISHSIQNINGRIGDLLSISQQLENYTVFYNGPASGASAPDHFHFQACPFGAMPIDNEIDLLLTKQSKQIDEQNNIKISSIENYLRTVYVLESSDATTLENYLTKLLKALPFDTESNEPMINLMCNYQNGKHRMLLFPRIAQRPSFYFKTGDEQIVVSVASVELGGIIVAPIKKDFERITSDNLIQIFDEVCLNNRLLDY
ncbi:MAG TPA: DUF4922 domain-containing protein [Prolixibacteraceae bacterium]|nr:DUF4922 domain-containing protein [Prolixibacteraceae bacterium]